MHANIRVREVRTCLLCGKEGRTIYKDLQDRLLNIPGKWTFMYCSRCEFVWLNPQPIACDIPKLYVDYCTHQLPIIDCKNGRLKLKKCVRSIVLNKYLRYSVECENKLLSKLLSFLILGPLKEKVFASVMFLKSRKSGRLLDVGCGNGWFLANMRKLGWEVVGIEPDKTAAHIAREYFNLNVFECTFEEAEITKESFDAITANHVIEHLLDPIGFFSKCYYLLKPGGNLIVVTPNIQSLGSRLFGKTWLYWDPPRHLFLFSIKSLRLCAELAGFRNIKLYTVTVKAKQNWIASKLIKQTGKLPGGCLPKNIPLEFRLQGVIFHIFEYFLNLFANNLGEEVVLYAVK